MTSAAGSDTPATSADAPTAGETADTRPEWTGRHRAEAPPVATQASPAPDTPEAGGSSQGDEAIDNDTPPTPTAAGHNISPSPTRDEALGNDTQPSSGVGEIGAGNDMSRASTGGQTGHADEDSDGAGRQASIRQRWAVIADLHEAGVATSDIAERVGITPGAVDLILQAHRRNRVTLRD